MDRLPVCDELDALSRDAQLSSDFDAALVMERAKYIIIDFSEALETLADNGFATAKKALAKARTY